jgi:hypothetical protein
LAWLTDVLERIVSGRTKRHELDTLLPWNWKAANLDFSNTSGLGRQTRPLSGTLAV